MVKPDQLIKRRGKLGLIGVNLNLAEVKEWLKPRMEQETMVRARTRGKRVVVCKDNVTAVEKPSAQMVLRYILIFLLQ